MELIDKMKITMKINPSMTISHNQNKILKSPKKEDNEEEEEEEEVNEFIAMDRLIEISKKKKSEKKGQN